MELHLQGQDFVKYKYDIIKPTCSSVAYDALT